MFPFKGFLFPALSIANVKHDMRAQSQYETQCMLHKIFAKMGMKQLDPWFARSVRTQVFGFLWFLIEISVESGEVDMQQTSAQQELCQDVSARSGDSARQLSQPQTTRPFGKAHVQADDCGEYNTSAQIMIGTVYN